MHSMLYLGTHCTSTKHSHVLSLIPSGTRQVFIARSRLIEQTSSACPTWARLPLSDPDLSNKQFNPVLGVTRPLSMQSIVDKNQNDGIQDREFSPCSHIMPRRYASPALLYVTTSFLFYSFAKPRLRGSVQLANSITSESAISALPH